MNIQNWKERYLEVAQAVTDETSQELMVVETKLDHFALDVNVMTRNEKMLFKRLEEIQNLRSNLSTQVEILNRNLAHLSTGIIAGV